MRARDGWFACHRAIILALLLLTSVLASQGYKADTSDLKEPAPAGVHGRSPTHRAITSDQRNAARQAEQAGITIQWHGQRGTPVSVRGAGLDQRRDFSGGKGLVRGARGDSARNAFVVLDNLARVFGLADAETEFALRKLQSDGLGFRHVRLTQMHRNLRVFGAELVVHFNATGEPYEVNGVYVPDLQVGPKTRLEAPSAVELAQTDLLAMGRPAGNLAAAPTLVVFAFGSDPVLAYELTLTTHDQQSGPGRWRYWIDAITGEVLLRYNDIQKIAPPTSNGADATISGSTLIGEGELVVTVPGWFENTGYYYLRNTNLAWLVYNIAASGYPDYNTYAHRSSSDWGTTDRAEISAARNFNLVQEYFVQRHGLNSFNGLGILAQANVHEGTSYVNAYWDGSQFYFGDGDGVAANPLAVLDICGHEYTHAVTDYSANLVYAYESGALSESFSDIFGAAIEFFAQADGRGWYPAKSPGTADWLCAEDSWLSTTALRDLRNPGNIATVGPWNVQPSSYQGPRWYSGTGDNGGVHFNSGVQNFFFYLLCEGGTGTNDGIRYSVAGIGIANAERVAYRALTVYCTPNTDYLAVRNAWMSAAQDLNPAWAPSVRAAWIAVGVGALTATPDTLVSRGPVAGPFIPAFQGFAVVNRNTAPVGWGVTTSAAWSDATPPGGTIPPGGTNLVMITFNNAASILPAGIYTNLLSFTNDADPIIITKSVRLLVGQPDGFTELFDLGDNDLDFRSLTFTPAGGASFYSVCLDTATNYFTDPAGGLPAALSDDSSVQVILPGTNTVAIYDRRTNVFHIGSNGYLTLDSGDSTFIESLPSHFSRPRVSACFDDLNPGAGMVTWKQTDDLVAVTFANVPEYGSTTTVNFQIELFFDGRIRLTWLGMGAADGLAGLSAGLGLPAGFFESDLTGYGACRPPDDLLVTPGGAFTAQGYAGGPFTPVSRTYTLSNAGTNAINWSVTLTHPWITVSSPDGTLPASGTLDLVVGLGGQANSLGPGVHGGSVTFSNLASGFSHTRSVVVTVVPRPGEIAVLDSIPPATDLQMGFGEVITGLSRTGQITITNADPDHPLVIREVAFGALQEDFNDGLAQNWTATTDAHWSVVAGEYRARAGVTNANMQSLYTGAVWRDCAAQVSTRRTGYESSAVVLVLRATDDFNWGLGQGSAYLLGISANGQYYVCKYVSGVLAFLQSWTASPYLTTTTNILLASVQGDSLRAYLNGNLVWNGTDTSVSAAGRVGLLAYSGGAAETVHYFDDVLVGEPITGLAAVAPEQQFCNASAQPGGLPQLAPAPGWQPGRILPHGGDVRSLALTSGPWHLENLPALPYTILPGGDLVFDVVYQPAMATSNSVKATIRSNDTDEPAVQLHLSGQGIPDYLVITPGANLVSQGHPGGPFTPASATYWLSNRSPVAVMWSVTGSQAWTAVEPSAGTLAGGEATPVMASITAMANSLLPGMYYDQIVFSNRTTSAAHHRDLSLNVFTSPFMVVAPAFLAVTNPTGASTNLTLMVSNAATADATLSFHLQTVETGRSLFTESAGGKGLPPAAHDFTRTAPGEPFAKARLLVRFQQGLAPAQRGQILAGLGGAQVRREFAIVPGLCLVELPPDQAVELALAQYNQTPGILYAEPDYMLKADLRLPNDPRFSELYGLHNGGQTSGTPDADIDAPEAWDLNTGNGQVLVAVIDTGIDYHHPDLVNNVWTNPGEIPGNALDDDSNGFVDDVHGFDFVNGDGDPLDDQGHGTHVAGTIGAEGNNGLGVAGVCWNVRLMALKFLDATGSGATSDAVLCLQYATAMGARVSNNSWGGGAYSQALKDTIDAAGAAGCVFVAAAGNIAANNDATPHYPSSYDSPNIVGVLSTDHNDLRSSFSSYGLNSVDLGAPGSSILSCQPGGGYVSLGGTSMAAPHVSGACALLLSANPLLSATQLKQTLLSTVDPVLPGVCVSGGRLNLAAALMSVGASWITVNPTGATNLPPGASALIDLSFQAGTLDPGIYSAELIVSGNDVATPRVSVPATMAITPNQLHVTTSAELLSIGADGGPFAPSTFLFTLTNRGTAPLLWQVTHHTDWLGIVPSGGELAPGASLSVTSSITAAAELLGPGQYTDALLFANLSTGGRDWRAVTLSVLTPALGILDAGVIEGHQGETNLLASVQLTPPSARPIAVSFATGNGTAQAGTDYRATNGLLTFPPGQTNASIAVTIFGDTNAESHERFYLTLSQPTHGTLVRAQATATIYSDDAGPFFDDFDPELDEVQWSEFGGVPGSTVLATNHGGAISGMNSLWFGAAASRFARTRPLDTSLGGTLDFWLRLAAGTSTVWEEVDLPSEGVVVEYSVNNGGAWVELSRYDTNTYTTWTKAVLSIPVEAQATNTLFRWRQLSHSGAGFDHWALDDVQALIGPQPPVITGQPQSLIAEQGGSATFCVSAAGSTPLAYQWESSCGPLVNETNQCLVLPWLHTNQSGCTYWVRVANAYGATNSTIATLTVVPGITLADAVDAPQLNWATAGNGLWHGEATNTHDQLDAAQSGTIGHSQSTWMETAVIGPGTLTFWWRTSSETSFDFLNFHVDGLLRCPGLSGILDWQQVNLPIPGGAHTLRWSYSKDGSVTAGSDAAWVDQVQFTPEFPPLSWQYTPGSNRITLTWDAPGMRLQAQTNTGTGGLNTNWFDCPGGETSPVSLPLDPAHPSVFFRLVSP